MIRVDFCSEQGNSLAGISNYPVLPRLWTCFTVRLLVANFSDLIRVTEMVLV